MNTIITIGRQTGSGGRYIGQKLAEELNIPFYDRNLLQRAAKESGFCEEIFEHHDEKPTTSFLYSLVMSTGMGLANNAFTDIPLDHKVFLAQFNTIRKIAAEGPCVIVGRCADYALEGICDTLSVFVYAPQEDRVRRMKERFSELNDAKALDQITRTDKKRSSYYNYYASKSWGVASTYDLCLNSSAFGLDGTADIIKRALEKKEAAKTQQ
ncbi:MAG: cytidylate kinase-like family protein [Lachnospiraceae bacterium]|nr:cytidylate kinase-like family protein [Lachnospiraceae bacterium]